MCVIEVTKEKQIMLVFEHEYKKKHTYTHNIESFIRFTRPIIMCGCQHVIGLVVKYVNAL